MLHPHLHRPNDLLVSYHLPQPATVTEVQIRAVGNVSLALCEVNVLGGKERSKLMVKPHHSGVVGIAQWVDSWTHDRKVDHGFDTRSE